MFVDIQTKINIKCSKRHAFEMIPDKRPSKKGFPESWGMERTKTESFVFEAEKAPIKKGFARKVEARLC